MYPKSHWLNMVFLLSFRITKKIENIKKFQKDSMVGIVNWVWFFLAATGMIMGAAVSTVYCNLKLKHPTLDMPVIDYDLVLLIQPMLMLGVSIGVICNVIFPNWLVTVLLIILFLGAPTCPWNCDIGGLTLPVANFRMHFQIQFQLLRLKLF